MAGGGLGPTRRLGRGLGMGGPGSMLAWNIGYDPIVDATGSPTFVDDLVGLTTGVKHSFRLHFFMLAAGAAAGLRIAVHNCVLLVADTAEPAALRALAVLGVEWSAVDGAMVLESVGTGRAAPVGAG